MTSCRVNYRSLTSGTFGLRREVFIIVEYYDGHEKSERDKYRLLFDSVIKYYLYLSGVEEKKRKRILRKADI